MIAFLGTGLLGSNFVRALLKRGEEVQIWNRMASKARALEPLGAHVFKSPDEAVRGAQRVHLTLSDDAAVDDVLERASKGLDPNAIIVDHTTTSPSGIAARFERWAARGITFQHAPVFMGPQNALEGTGVMLTSGDRAIHDRLEAELDKMTGKLIYLGPQIERAAGFKLLGNAFLMALTLGLSDMFALAKTFDIAPEDAASMFAWFNPGTTINARAKRMIDAAHGTPSWELSMARKDARLMIEDAEKKNVRLSVIPAIAEEMDRWIARGHGAHDWTVVAQDAFSK